MCDVEFNIVRLKFRHGNVWEYSLNYVLGLRNFVADKIPDDGSSVPKHTGTGV
jgi:hypothetical protein